MNIFPIFKELTPINLRLDDIFLDPNNPRFITDRDILTPVEQYDNPKLQEAIQVRLINEYSVEKLIMNMEINGFLPIDRVVVKKFDENKFVVLEGNRRICAAKNILKRYRENPAIINDDIIDSLETISCLLYTGTDGEASWVFQGLRHITGLAEWSAFNKAKLLVDMMDEEGLTLTEVGKRFGLTAHGAGQWVRGYSAYKQAKNHSDYIREVDEKSYPYFQELFGNSNKLLRDWMGWDDNERKFTNELNFNEFIGWLYPRDEKDVMDGQDLSDVRGEFRNRLLTSRDDLRKISYLLKESSHEFQHFRVSGNLEQAHALALQKQYDEQSKRNEDPTEEVFKSIRECTKSLENIPLKIIKNEETRRNLFELLQQLERSIQDIKD